MLGLHQPKHTTCEVCGKEAEASVDDKDLCLTHGAARLRMSIDEFKNLLIERGILHVNVNGVLITIDDLQKAYDEM